MESSEIDRLDELILMTHNYGYATEEFYKNVADCYAYHKKNLDRGIVAQLKKAS